MSIILADSFNYSSSGLGYFYTTQNASINQNNELVLAGNSSLAYELSNTNGFMIFHFQLNLDAKTSSYQPLLKVFSSNNNVELGINGFNLELSNGDKISSLFLGLQSIEILVDTNIQNIEVRRNGFFNYSSSISLSSLTQLKFLGNSDVDTKISNLLIQSPSDLQFSGELTNGDFSSNDFSNWNPSGNWEIVSAGGVKNTATNTGDSLTIPNDTVENDEILLFVWNEGTVNSFNPPGSYTLLAHYDQGTASFSFSGAVYRKTATSADAGTAETYGSAELSAMVVLQNVSYNSIDANIGSDTSPSINQGNFALYFVFEDGSVTTNDQSVGKRIISVEQSGEITIAEHDDPTETCTWSNISSSGGEPTAYVGILSFNNNGFAVPISPTAIAGDSNNSDELTRIIDLSSESSLLDQSSTKFKLEFDRFSAESNDNLNVRLEALDANDNVLDSTETGQEAIQNLTSKTLNLTAPTGTRKLKIRNIPGSFSNTTNTASVNNFSISSNKNFNIFDTMDIDFLGPSTVTELPPASDVDVNWQSSTGDPNYQNVDEKVPDNDSSFNETSVPSTDLFSHNGITNDSNIQAVVKEMFVKNDSEETFISVYNDNNSTIEFNTIELKINQDYTKLIENVDKNPISNNSWDKANLNSLNFGYRLG